MRHIQNARRFRTNPVEIAIFAIAAVICFKSVYNLFYDHQSFQATALTSNAASPLSEGRVPASSIQNYFNLEIRCDENNAQETHATKMRLSGELCGASKNPNQRLLKTEIINTANRFAATVFTETNNQRFSTDYIPLNSGKNPIHLEFTYEGGKVFSHDRIINKN
ncbi:MAG: hypothetical protein AABZ55_00820 [Bdellovibrionota bacterium]